MREAEERVKTLSFSPDPYNIYQQCYNIQAKAATARVAKRLVQESDDMKMQWNASANVVDSMNYQVEALAHE